MIWKSHRTATELSYPAIAPDMKLLPTRVWKGAGQECRPLHRFEQSTSHYKSNACKTVSMAIFKVQRDEEQQELNCKENKNDTVPTSIAKRKKMTKEDYIPVPPPVITVTRPVQSNNASLLNVAKLDISFSY